MQGEGATHATQTAGAAGRYAQAAHLPATAPMALGDREGTVPHVLEGTGSGPDQALHLLRTAQAALNDRERTVLHIPAPCAREGRAEEGVA